MVEGGPAVCLPPRIALRGRQFAKLRRGRVHQSPRVLRDAVNAEAERSRPAFPNPATFPILRRIGRHGVREGLFGKPDLRQ
jgi:hypothetical protein